MLAAVRSAAAGHAPLDPRVARVLLPSTAARPEDATLSARELEVLPLVAQGLANKQIGRKLGISERTVKVHLGNVFRQIGVADRTSAALWAHDHLPDRAARSHRARPDGPRRLRRARRPRAITRRDFRGPATAVGRFAGRVATLPPAFRQTGRATRPPSITRRLSPGRRVIDLGGTRLVRLRHRSRRRRRARLRRRRRALRRGDLALAAGALARQRAMRAISAAVQEGARPTSTASTRRSRVVGVVLFVALIFIQDI